MNFHVYISCIMVVNAWNAHHNGFSFNYFGHINFVSLTKKDKSSNKLWKIRDVENFFLFLIKLFVDFLLENCGFVIYVTLKFQILERISKEILQLSEKYRPGQVLLKLERRELEGFRAISKNW